MRREHIKDNYHGGRVSVLVTGLGPKKIRSMATAELVLVWERRGCWEVHSVQFRSVPRSAVELIAADLGDDLVLVGESGCSAMWMATRAGEVALCARRAAQVRQGGSFWVLEDGFLLAGRHASSCQAASVPIQGM